jgi:hypothetical protein
MKLEIEEYNSGIGYLFYYLLFVLTVCMVAQMVYYVNEMLTLSQGWLAFEFNKDGHGIIILRLFQF